MHMSQKRFFLIMQKLETIERELSLAKKASAEYAPIITRIEKNTDATDTRLMLMGLALLLKDSSVNPDDRLKYNDGWEVSFNRKD